MRRKGKAEGKRGRINERMKEGKKGIKERRKRVTERDNEGGKEKKVDWKKEKRK